MTSMTVECKIMFAVRELLTNLIEVMLIFWKTKIYCTNSILDITLCARYTCIREGSTKPTTCLNLFNLALTDGFGIEFNKMILKVQHYFLVANKASNSYFFTSKNLMGRKTSMRNQQKVHTLASIYMMKEMFFSVGSIVLQQKQHSGIVKLLRMLQR